MAAQKRPGFRLKGLEFHVKIAELEIDAAGGEAAEVPQLRGMVADQIAKALQPVTQGLLPGIDVTPPAPTPAATTVDAEKRRRASRPRAANSPAASNATALPWKPNSTPDGEWTNGKKALWLLYFFSKENGGTEAAPKGLSLPVVIATYNKHFPFAKPVDRSHVRRDLNKFAGMLPPLVRADRNANPPVWYIAPAGAALVADMMKGHAVSATTPSAA